MASNDDNAVAECSESDELDGDLLEQCLAAFQDANYTEAVRLLLLVERSKFDHQTGRLVQLLQLAIKNRWLNVAVKYLITERGCDPMVADDDGRTCLHLAVWNNHIDIVKYLITEHGCYPMVADNDGRTCLHLAVWNNHIDIVKYLITEHGCYPMIADNYGRTCLDLAVWNNHIDIVKYLITEHGCYPMIADNYGRMCLHLAVLNNHIDIVKYLITEHGCYPMIADNDGRTCLHLAVWNNHIDIVKYLITEHGCYPMVADNDGRTCLHLAVRNNHIDIIKYLITEHGCDPMVADNDGRTCLHLAVWNNHIDIVKYLITEHGCDPMVADNDGKTCLNFDIVDHEIFSVLTKIDDMKKFNQVDSYVNVLLLGQSGAGKSTLAQVIIKRAIGTLFLGLVRNVSGIEPFTAGIIPTAVHRHKEFGNIILHDFAGHPEYYSSHTAVIENLLQGAGAVFILVVDITKEDSTKHLQQWLTVVSNEVYKCIRRCHIIVAVSHIDEMTDASIKNKRLKELSDIIMVKCGFDVSLKCLDCRKLGGGNINSLVNVLSKCCQSIRSANQLNNLGVYCHMMYGFLKNNPKNVLSLSDIVNSPLRDEYFLSKNEEKIIEILSLLHMIGLICLILSINTSKVWVVVNKQILLAEVNGILFAPKSFKQYNRNIASNTGIITSSSLTHLFPHYDPDMLICFFVNMALCEEITSQLLTMTNLKALKEDDKLLFFPALLNIDRPHDITGRVFEFGWCLQCNEEYFFPPRFFHILMLKLAYKFGLPKHSSHLPIINRQCTFWSNGIHWCNGEGVETLVEMVDESQCVLVLMSYQAGYEENMISLRRNVITEVMEVHSQSFPSLKTFEFVIDPEELKYPIDKPTQRTLYNVADIAACVKSGKDFVNSERDPGNNKVLKQIAIRELLTSESTTTDITRLSILQGRDFKKLTSNHGDDYVNEEYTENEDCSLDITDTQGSVNETSTVHVVDRVREDSHDIGHLTDLRKAVTSPVVKKQETTVSSSYKDKLDISDLDDIISFLKRNQFANHQWQELGLQLGLYKPTLEDIDDKCRGDPRKCLRECLAAWLKGEDKVMDKGGPSWTPLADALHVIGERNIAICINSRQ